MHSFSFWLLTKLVAEITVYSDFIGVIHISPQSEDNNTPLGIMAPITCSTTVRISPVALRLGSEMDPYRRDLTNILPSYLILDSFGPVLGARAWSCKTANNYLGLSRLRNTSETFRGRCLRLPPGLSMFCITFLLYGLLGLTILDHIYSSFL